MSVMRYPREGGRLRRRGPRTKDRTRGQHTYAGQAAKEHSAKEMEKGSRGDRGKSRGGWEQRGVRVAQERWVE